MLDATIKGIVLKVLSYLEKRLKTWWNLLWNFLTDIPDNFTVSLSIPEIIKESPQEKRPNKKPPKLDEPDGKVIFPLLIRIISKSLDGDKKAVVNICKELATKLPYYEREILYGLLKRKHVWIRQGDYEEDTI